MKNRILILSNILFSVTKTKEREKLPFQYLRIYYQIRGKHYIHRAVKVQKTCLNCIVITTGITKIQLNSFLIHKFFFTEKKCSIKRNCFAHDCPFFFLDYFAFVHYHAKINISDLTKLKEQTLFFAVIYSGSFPSIFHIKDLCHFSTTTSNYTSPPFTAFLLTGVPGLEDFQIWISTPFSFMYLLAVTGNGLVMVMVIWDRSLHEPMYLFLAMLALNHVLLCTVTVNSALLFCY